MRNAMPIAWHEECYANQVEHHKRIMEALYRATMDAAKSTESLDEYRRLIDCAKRDGKKSFDRERCRGKNGRKVMKP